MNEVLPPWDPRRIRMNQGWSPINPIPSIWEVVPVPDQRYSQPLMDDSLDVQAQHVEEAAAPCSLNVYVLIALYDRGADNTAADYLVYHPNEVIVGVYTNKKQAESVKQLLEVYKDNNIQFFIEAQKLQ